jgi:hypothetical protein
VGVLLLGAAGLFAWLNRDVPRPAPVAAGSAAQPAAAPVKPALPASAPFDPVAALDAVLAGASPDRKVTVQASNPRVRIGRDQLGFSIRSSHAGYVYVHMVGTEGNDFHQLFPNAVDSKNRIAAGEVLTLPRRGWRVVAGGPPGTDHLVVMVSDVPRDFSAAGLVAGDPFSAFPFERAAALQRAYTGWTPLFAGVPACKEQPCPAAYGAAPLSIDEISATD